MFYKAFIHNFGNLSAWNMAMVLTLEHVKKLVTPKSDDLKGRGGQLFLFSGCPRNIMTSPIQRSHIRNKFLLWCTFCHLN
jgi:hypothetical protein